jgi:hypothetical protein
VEISSRVLHKMSKTIVGPRYSGEIPDSEQGDSYCPTLQSGNIVISGGQYVDQPQDR